MADKHVDEGKGRLKEAAGNLADDQGLKDEGRADQAKGDIQGQGGESHRRSQRTRQGVGRTLLRVT